MNGAGGSSGAIGHFFIGVIYCFFNSQKHALTLNTFHGFFHTASRAADACCTTYFLPTAA
jgi:hypothetical protein